MSYFTQLQIFLKGEPLVLAEIFPIQKFTSFTTEKSYVSDTSHKVDMGKTVIFSTLANYRTIIIVLFPCMVSICTCVCTRVSEKSSFSAVAICTQRIQSRMARPFSCTGNLSLHNCLQYKHLAMPLTMVIYATQLSIYAELSTRPTIVQHMYVMYSQLLLLSGSLKYIAVAKYMCVSIQLFITTTVANYNFSISSWDCSEHVLLLNRGLYCIQQVSRDLLDPTQGSIKQQNIFSQFQRNIMLAPSSANVTIATYNRTTYIIPE